MLRAEPVCGEAHGPNLDQPGRAAAGPVAIPHARSLNVCHVVSADLWAGAEVQVATAAASLVSEHEVRLSAALLNDGQLATALRHLGVPVTVVDERQHSALAIVVSLARLFRQREIDVVHTHQYKDTVLATLAAVLAGVPHVVRTVHGLREPLAGWNRSKFRVYEALEHAALRWRADAMVAVSNYIASDLLHSGHDPAAVVRIHNGIDLRNVVARRTRDAVRHELGIDAASLVIGTAGRLVPVKGHSDLLRAAQQVLRLRPDATFLIVGDGPLRNDLRTMAEGLGIARACVFTGARDDAHDLIAAMDVFALPSLSEGTPMALLEAMALGVPVVASAVGGVPEVVQPEHTGLLVPPGDAEALAAACLRLGSDWNVSNRLTAGARRTVQSVFSSDRNCQALIETYRRVAAAPHVVRGIDVPGAWGLAALDVLDRVHRRFTRALERLRQRHARVRGSAEARTALLSARRLLIVCQGNIIRSAFASRLIATALAADPHVHVTSAGLEAESGTTPHPHALSAAVAWRVDLTRHRATRLDAVQVSAADVIFVMDVAQLATIRARFPDARGKTFLLTAFAPDVPLEVADPVLGDEGVFHTCFDHLSRAVAPLVRLAARWEVQS